MSTRTGTPGITFAVEQVERATKPLPTCKTHEALSPIVAWSLAEFLDRALGSGGKLDRLQPPS
jgi:hypothetical protein